MILEFGIIKRTREPNKSQVSIDMVISSEEIPSIHPIELTLYGHSMENTEEITDTYRCLNISKEGAKQLASLLLEMTND